MESRTLQSRITWCTRAQWALGAVMSLAVAAFYFVGYRPQTGHLESILAQVKQKQQQLEGNQRDARARTEIAAKNEKLRRELDRIKKPSKQEELPQLVKDLTLAGQQASLRKFIFKPGVPVRNDLFLEMPLAVTFEGDFVDVFGFLRNTEEMQRLTRVRNMSLKVKDSKSGQVQAQMAVNIYFSVE
jgi:type IV pilus assembly protein PilO